MEKEKEKKKREILILNCEEIVCPQVLLYVFRELCYAFREKNYVVREINSVLELHNNAIVFMGDGIRVRNAVEMLNILAPEAIYVGWYWEQRKLHHSKVSNLKYFLHVYENYMDKKALPSHRSYFAEIEELKNTCPILLRARERPDKVGIYPRVSDTHCMDYCYMGWRYCPEMVPSQPKYKGVYHGVLNHNLFWSYEHRRDIYLSSIVALGFQSEENILTKHVSQRIYEGLAYGCIVLTNSAAAVEQTNDIAVLVKSREEVEYWIDYYKANKEERQKKQQKGYEFIKTEKGTNHDAVGRIIDTIKREICPDL